MTPGQVELVRGSLDAVRPRLGAMADDFYGRLFASDPDLRPMFPNDLILLREKFVDELDAIVAALGDLGTFLGRAGALGARHAGYGVRNGHYGQVREALLAAFARGLGPAWNPELESAWRAAYDMVAEAMMIGSATGRQVARPA